MKRRLKQLWREWIWPTALFLAVTAPLRSAVVDWNWVPSGSMKPTILVGDLVLVNKLAYDLKVPFTSARLSTWAAPERGDVVVLYSPRDGTRLVKRVVGLPGDVIEMRSDVLTVNGRPQPYALADPGPFAHELAESEAPVVAVEHLGTRSHLIAVFPERPAMRTFAAVRVPAGSYFVMGDCRDNSLDSRYFGTVPRASIVGRASRVLVSFDPSRCLLPRIDRVLKDLSPSQD